MAIYFEKGSGHEIGGDVIAFHGTRDDQRLNGLITREALEDLWAPAPPKPAERWVDMFDTLEQQVFDIASAKIARGRLEPDGSVMVRAEDRHLI